MAITDGGNGLEAALRRHLTMLDTERQAFGPAYAPGGWLFVWENGQRRSQDPE